MLTRLVPRLDGLAGERVDERLVKVEAPIGRLLQELARSVTLRSRESLEWSLLFRWMANQKLMVRDLDLSGGGERRRTARRKGERHVPRTPCPATSRTQPLLRAQ